MPQTIPRYHNGTWGVIAFRGWVFAVVAIILYRHQPPPVALIAPMSQTEGSVLSRISLP